MDQGEQSQPDALGGLFSRLARDASGLVRAEIALHRSAFAYRLELTRPALLALLGALFLLQAAVACLLVMIAISISAHLGPLWAGVIVAGGGIVVAGGVAIAGLKRLKHAAEIRLDEEP